ncbi:MAG: ABC transporter permease [Clostridiales Family XIII bacterium]|jgi:ABC-2 type transport system permease protein|nr:ABC transporter permease [Clostridiales Family XIII bacterium]
MFRIMQKEFLGMLRDRSGFVFSLIFPVVLVFVLGNMLASLDNADAPIEEIRLAYIVETQNPAEAAAIDEFLTVMEENSQVKLTESDDFSVSKVDVDKGDLDACVVFSEPFSVTIAEGGDLVKNRAVKLTMQSFAREYAAISVLMAHVGVEDSGSWAGMTGIDGATFAPVPSRVALSMTELTDLTVDKDLGVNRSMIDYYAVMMIVMIVFMSGSSIGASSVYQSKQDGTMRRTMLSPVSRSKYFASSLLGFFPLHILSVLCVMVPSVLFFGAHYANTWQGNVLLFIGLSVVGMAATGVCMITGIFMKTNPFIPFMAVVWVLLFFSGTFSKEIFITGFSEYLPTSMIRAAAFDLTIFGRPDGMILVTVVSIGVTAITAAIGSALLRRKELVA